MKMKGATTTSAVIDLQLAILKNNSPYDVKVRHTL